MRILVVGAGATGGFFGGRLAQAGRDVTFLVREARAAQLRETGLKIITPTGTDTIMPRVTVANELAEGAPVDLVLVAVKGQALEPAVADFASAVGESTTIVPFLNGMRHMDILNRRFGAGRVLGGVVRIVASTDDDGNPVQYLPGADMQIGEPSGTNGERVTAIAQTLTVDGYELAISADIIGAMWQKWVFLASTAAITTLLRGTIGEIASVPDGVGFASSVVREAAAISRAAGHPLPDQARGTIEALLTDPSSKLTASLFRDVLAGRPVEVEPVIGDLVQRAGALHLSVPLLTVALAGLRVYERRLDAAQQN
jgi:2-dehydropantoate 2-reductase